MLKEKPKKVCGICGKVFEVSTKHKTQKYCSKKCFYEKRNSPEVREKIVEGSKKFWKEVKEGKKSYNRVYDNKPNKKLSITLKEQYKSGKVSPRQISKEKEELIINEYNIHSNIRVVCNLVGVGRSAVRACLKRNKIVIKDNKGRKLIKPKSTSYCTAEWRKRQSNSLKKAFEEGRAKVDKTTTSEQDKIIVRMYTEDMMSVPRIAKITGINLHTIYLRLEEFGIDRRSITKSNHPFWKGGRSQVIYGNNWKTRRKEALKRDDYTCQYCGKKEKLHVHHKISILTYKTEKEKCEIGNDLSNLITLCKHCHITEHYNNKLINLNAA